MTVKRKLEGLERRWLDKLANELEGSMKKLRIEGLLTLHRSGPGAVAILERGLDSDTARVVVVAIRAALPGLGMLLVLPDNGRG